ncbi:MAG: phosphoribosylpyrophosphate synthetase [Puia sp.]|nr:phosphoribosylpyrophosphate synthetase [Puia sp.]
MFNYDTMTEALTGLKQRGYTIDFNLDADCLRCPKTPLALKPDEFEITEVYRFEGDSDPADEGVVFAIESHHGDKGVLVNGFGVSSDALDDKMVEKLKFRHL